MNTFDAKEFLATRGYVTDKEEAINLLILTSKAWEVIDQWLKTDPDVIMFYQPTGYKRLVSHEDVGVTLTIFTTYSEKHFYRPLAGQLQGYEPKGALFIPYIDYPEGFDFAKYEEIQQEMKRNITRIPLSNVPLAEQCNYTYEDGAYPDDGSYRDEDEEGLFVYDRTVLAKYATQILGNRQP